MNGGSVRIRLPADAASEPVVDEDAFVDRLLETELSVAGFRVGTVGLALSSRA
jgi:hypothetical protein